MDEYIGLPKNDPRTFAGYPGENIFDKLNFHTVNYIDGNAEKILGPNAADTPDLLRVNTRSDYSLTWVLVKTGILRLNDPPVADFNDLVSGVKRCSPF